MFAPFGNQTANQTATWHPEPHGRGTFGLLSSCITTLVLCVYTAVHLNIPEHGKERQQYFRKFGWVVLGLLAPEIVAWNAWEQYRTASRITRAVHKAYPPALMSPWYRIFWASCKRAPRRWFSTGVDTEECLDSQIPLGSLNTDTSAHRHPWTLTHGFYAAMGGFVIQARDLGSNYGTGDFVLSERGIDFLARTEPESVPNISESEVLDKSKASTLAKTIVCLQALWFCIQCIARLSQGASISFLELNVLGHCLCAFATYAIWWKKPTDVSQPTSMSVSDGLREYADVVHLFSGRPGTLPTFPTVPGTRSSVRLNASALLDARSNTPALASIDDRFDRHDPQLYETITTNVLFGDLLRSTITDIRCFARVHLGTQFCVLKLQFHSRFWVGYVLPGLDNKRHSVLESTDNVPRIIFDLAPAMAESLERASKSRYEPDSTTSSHRVKNWSLSSDSIDNAVWFKEPLSTITLSIVGLAYGGLHLLAWNAPFHTQIEGLLWKISGISVASIGPASAIFVGCLSVTDYFPANSHSIRGVLWLILGFVLWTIGFLFIGGYILLYLFARVYLVVECFIEVAYLPDSAFTTPVFTRYIPHFG